MTSVIALVFACIATIAARMTFIVASGKAAVDHYYWLLAARAYRQARSLPAVIPGKYLLESEQQFYPPLFGWLLSKVPERILTDRKSIWLGQVADVFVLVLLTGYAVASGLSLLAIAIIMAIYGTAPVLVAYNTQIASRAFGNLFLVACMLSAGAVSVQDNVTSVVLLYVLAVCAAAAVVLTHKMTTQLLLALWPFWPFAFGNWYAALVPPLGVALAALLTGHDFARMQWLAHADIVCFWHRHRDELGAHAFEHSPVYGDPSRREESAFHRSGWRGAVSHAMLAFSYGPLVWLLPLTLLFAPWPSDWILLWTLGPALLALVTLYVPWLRCLGGGHFYMFNAIAPAALWWGTILPSGDAWTVALFSLGGAATLVSLAGGYRRRVGIVSRRDQDFEDALAATSSMPPGRIAVFPLTAAEEVAFRSPHAVLWGAHSLGFRRLEPVFPTLKIPLRMVVSKFACNLVLFDTRYWRNGTDVIAVEMASARTMVFGSWRLVVIAPEGFAGATDSGVHRKDCQCEVDIRISTENGYLKRLFKAAP